jgi:hypothetical protein
VEDDAEQVLLVGMPLRHLVAAADICTATGTAVLPAGGVGELDQASAGTEVLFIASEAGEHEVPAVTWRAEFAGIVPTPADSFPEGLPAEWIAEREADPATPQEVPRSAFGDDDDEDEVATVDGGQTFFQVRALGELPRSEWVFVNELVPKQERGGRTFFPRTPRLVTRPV